LQRVLTGLEKFVIKGHKSFIESRCKITRYGRNPGGLVVYVKNIIDKYVDEIVKEMKEIIRIELKIR
jgi:hypothetical protein